MDIENSVKKFITENILYSFDGYPYSDEDSFLETGVIDSLGIMELVLFVGEEFNITIEDNEVVPQNFDSIQKISDYIRTKMNGGE